MMQLHRKNLYVNQQTDRAFERDFLFVAQPWHSGNGNSGQPTATGIFDQTRINLTQEVGHGIHP